MAQLPGCATEVGHDHENDNNKNRKYNIVDARIRKTYARDSAASSVSKIYDPYVKFFRWAVDRLGDRDGIICIVSNNSFLEQTAFDGMRKNLIDDFDLIYHIDMRGNVRKNPKLSGSAYNVFGIQVGVGITVAVRSPSASGDRLLFHRMPEDWRRESKLNWLAKHDSINKIDWVHLTPDARNTWLVPDNEDEFSAYLSIGSKEAKAGLLDEAEVIFKTYSLGVVTARDEIVYSFDLDALRSRVLQFIEDYNAEVDRFLRAGSDSAVDDFVKYDKLKWSEGLKLNLRRGIYARFNDDKLRKVFYRPFCQKQLFYDKVLNEKLRLFPFIFPSSKIESENRLLWIKVGTEWPMFSLVTNLICDSLPQGGSQCFPFYTYDEDGTNRRENITDWALIQFREHYKNPKITKWDIFHYVYGVLHQPEYRSTFADNLKRELPRIPFMDDFEAFAGAGRSLARWHLEYESVEPWPLTWVETPGVPLSYEVAKMKLSKDKGTLTVNGSLALADIPPEVVRYRLGNRSALEWVVDQYQVSEDARSGIRSDPNRPDDPESIVRLVGQVVKVSVETVRIVEGLPPGIGVGLGTA